MLLLELGTNKVLVDFTDSPKLHSFEPHFVDANGQSYRRHDRRLVSNNSKTFKAELRFELQRLTQADIDTLRSIYQRQKHFICVPEPIEAPERVYVVRWTSGFDRHDSVVTNWSLGRSLTAVFRQI